ncbi:hypothetical protein CI109_100438 [Kwoniella shandongensis]|uniref:Uncharacterized protein n=1 Tax=Kwoniella shandongensis TaxID=1734106 RepID=A0A5M6C9A8_9TREE|nr:uncharacterized protein CI109_001718 [Kwoniella shandongensis]KAA5529779.1 hypothetical protein CI109_001718 [Kwoniella shandongensis]
MAPPSLHPLPANPTTGQQPLASLGGGGGSGRIGGGYSAAPPASASSGGVSRDTLKGLQDVYWSEDEDDPDCLLCAEPLDLSDLNFKPCQCGLQICQFCYNKLLQTDSRCPGCRRPYDAKAVVFQPVDWEEVKRAKERKTKRAKTIKQLTSMGRRHLLNVRIVMKNTVYVVGMKLPAPGDEAIPILRSNDYFGQYGKISKLYLGDRTKVSSSSVTTLTPDNPSTSTGIYIVYIRREDAARAIASLDGIPAPQGPPGSVLKATYGTTRYCDAFLRGTKCDNSTCHSLHEWGGESDCFTKEDMDTALTRPQEYDARQKQTQLPPPSLSSKIAWPKPSAEDVNGSSSTGLPSGASWGKGVGTKGVARPPPPSAISRPTKIGNLVPLGKNNSAFPLPTPSPTIPITIKEKKERKSGASAMARGRSTDSAQSATTSSNQTSPKKKPSALLPVTSVKSVPAPSGPAPPPGIPTSAPSSSTAPTSEPADESVDERFSADSDAGPSSSSPAPQTPARTTEDIPPAPLSSEPILIHSPYPEPVIFSFPAHDKDFAFVLGLDDGELQLRQAQAEGYEPSPFSKTLEGLAELGVHAPEVPDLFTAPASPLGSMQYTGLFRPFEADDNSPALSDNTPGPSRSREEDHNAQRTESRFGFARTNSASARGQSPFSALRRSVAEPPNLRDGWYTRQNVNDESLLHQLHNDNRAASLAAQVASFVGSYDSSSATEAGWTGESAYSASPSHHRQLGMQNYDRGNDGRRLDHGMLQGQFMQAKGLRVDRDDYEAPLLQYGNAQIYGNQAQQQPQQPQQQQQQRNMFSPESAPRSIHDDAAFQSPMAFSQLQAQQTPMQHPDARQLMQLHHQNRQSPSPMPAHAYRRF